MTFDGLFLRVLKRLQHDNLAQYAQTFKSFVSNFEQYLWNSLDMMDFR